MLSRSPAQKQPPRDRDERNRDLALHHATLLQERKDTEAQILSSLEELLECPDDQGASPSRPSSTDLSLFRDLIAPFQISDYDSLLQERNIVGKCGYTLCPRPFRKESRATGIYEVLRSGHVVPRDEVRRWCSKACARRAMFIKVQLSEVPAWERQGGLGSPIEVLQDDDEDALAAKMKYVNIGNEEEELRNAMNELALERSEQSRSGKPKQVMKTSVAENSAVRPPQEPDASNLSTSGIEGYVPRSEKLATTLT